MATLGRHSDREPRTLLTWIPRVIIGYVALVLVIGGLTLGWVLMRSNSGSALTSPSVTQTGTPSSPARAVSEESVLVANAKKVKPLEDLERGDRVIFRGRVCIWQLWNNSINTSTIKCPGRNPFQTQTGRLTPVELRLS